MNWVVLLYDISAASTLLYALLAGGLQEKAAALLNVVASLLSVLVTPELHSAFKNPELALLAMDLLAALGFYGLMVTSRSFWPIWAFAFAAAGPVVTVARLLTPEVPAIAYYTTEGIWAYGTMLAIVVGTAARSRPWMVLRV